MNQTYGEFYIFTWLIAFAYSSPCPPQFWPNVNWSPLVKNDNNNNKPDFPSGTKILVFFVNFNMNNGLEQLLFFSGHLRGTYWGPYIIMRLKWSSGSKRGTNRELDTFLFFHYFFSSNHFFVFLKALGRVEWWKAHR